MTIRRTLLISYLLISLSSALLITLMIFVHLRDIVRAEIENKLKSQASTIMQQIDTTLFERMENMAMWSHLDVMQEIRVRDVDKRLAHFLRELHESYDGVYKQLFVINQDHEIISADDARLIGTQHAYAPAWLEATHGEHTHALQPLKSAHDNLYLSIAVDDAFQIGELGRLYAGFDWREIVRLLDATLPFSAAPSYALLLDSDNRIIASSSKLNGRLQLQRLSSAWQWSNEVTGALSTTADFLDNQSVLVGYARSQGYRAFQGFGWRVLILQPAETAFAPMWDLWLAILIFLGLTLLLGSLVSLWMSAKIARPIVHLAEFTRDFMHGKQSPVPEFSLTSKSDEIRELIMQFSLMIDNLEQSRLDVARVAKLAVIGEMAASMAHEVRTPLGILRSSAQMLQREPCLSTVGLEMTDFILSETTRLNELVTTLLACARPRAPNCVRQNFHPIIEHTVELLQSQADARKVQFIVQLNAEQALLACDRDHCIQVLLNLIMNALQHVKAQGRVVISTQLNEGYLETTVCDDGVGISDANKTNVFDPFFTQRQDGIGLGLTVVQQIILAHQGKIFVTDSVWGGACFHVLLPL